MDSPTNYLDNSIPEYYSTLPPSYKECVPNMPACACPPPPIAVLSNQVIQTAACSPPATRPVPTYYSNPVPPNEYAAIYNPNISDSPGATNYIICSNCDQYFTTYIYPHQILDYVCSECIKKQNNSCFRRLCCWYNN
jgi:hypothetical protein